MSEIFSSDMWKHQWDAFMSAPYIMIPPLILTALATWWFRGSLLSGTIAGLKEQIVNLSSENASQKEIFENRKQLAAETVEKANRAGNEVERRLQRSIPR
jgi:hypothetical protein